MVEGGGAVAVLEGGGASGGGEGDKRIAPPGRPEPHQNAASRSAALLGLEMQIVSIFFLAFKIFWN